MPFRSSTESSARTTRIGRSTRRVYAERVSRELGLGAANVAFGPDRLDLPFRPERMQAANVDATDLLGHARIEAKLAVTGLETEHRLHEHERGPSGPCLRA